MLDRIAYLVTPLLRLLPLPGRHRAAGRGPDARTLSPPTRTTPLRDEPMGIADLCLTAHEWREERRQGALSKWLGGSAKIAGRWPR